MEVTKEQMLQKIGIMAITIDILSTQISQLEEKIKMLNKTITELPTTESKI